MPKLMNVRFIVALLFSSVVSHTAPFQNLDFESARTNSLTQSMDFHFDYYGPTADLLPGWQVFHGNQAVTAIGFNLTPVGKSSYATVVSSAPPNFGLFPPAIGGKYGLWFNVGSDPCSLVQSGEIPSDARLLAFTIRGLPFAVSVNGVNLSPSIQNGGDPPEGRIVFVDIAQFAGENVELKFTTSSGPFGSNGAHEIDSIRFVLKDRISVMRRSQSNGLQQVVIIFAPDVGKNHFVESCDDFGGNSAWQPLPDGPHNSGLVTNTVTASQRFYRLRIADQ